MNYDYTAAVNVDKDNATVKDTVTLSENNSWYKEWISGLDNSKYYYIVETKVGGKEVTSSGYDVEYSENNSGIKTGTITVKNSKTTPQTGALNITKAVTVNGGQNGISTLTDGTYTFKVYEADGTTEAKKADGSAIENLSITLAEGVPTPSELNVDGLAPGTYVVKEISSDNASMSMVTEGVEGYDAGKGGIVVTVDADDTTPTPTAAFTNNYEMTSFEFSKVWYQDETQTTDHWGGDITVVIKRSIGNDTSNAELVGEYLIHQNEDGTFTIPEPLIHKGGFTFALNDLPKRGKIGNNEGAYTYFVAEKGTVTGYKDPSYTSPSATDGGQMPTEGYALNGGKIINKPVEAYELPHTGGIGTVIFYVLGSILVIGGGIYFISRRRAMK